MEKLFPSKRMENQAQIGRQQGWLKVLKARHVALPAEHGAWVFLLSPLIIGLVLGGIRPSNVLLVLLALAVFLVRQPITMIVKVLSGRRPQREMPAAMFWLAVYGLIALLAGTGLILLGDGFVFWLGIPAAPVLAWHLWLVARRAERRQLLVEILGSGVLALSATAALWIGKGRYSPVGWGLWLLLWLQVSGSILYAYLRLEQRGLKQPPDRSESFRMGRNALVFNMAIFFVVMIAAVLGWVSIWLPVAFALQPAEVLWGIWHPAEGSKPKEIGFRQLAISALFTLFLLLCW